MTTVTTLAHTLSTHPGPWNGGYGWFPFFPFIPFFGFFFFGFLLFLVFGVFGRRRGWGGPPHRDAVQSAERLAAPFQPTKPPVLPPVLVTAPVA